MDRYEALKHYFGHSEFRPGQEELIDAILSKRDALGVMPTGGGKSLCYQIPALLLPGVTLVISPLISLMQDQVSALQNAGIPAAFLNSSLSAEQLHAVYHRVREGSYSLLYIAPERLEAEGFAALAQRLPISLVAVDEAHCISQWGQDFRPSYLKIADFIASLPRRPVVTAFTATATDQVREDIIRLLRLNDPFCRVTSFDRPNLFFDVQRPKDKLSALLTLLQGRENQSGIVYCSTRAAVEQVCQELCSRGISATRYHAGLDEAERRRNQDDFQFDRKTVMVATNAFGMGIDKSNVSFVFHYHMPKSIEAYYQEAGRAGRDGEPADCVLLFSPKDVETARFLIAKGGNEALSAEERAAVYQHDMERLYSMVGYCKTTKCFRWYLLRYFGQEHPEICCNCGNCNGAYQTQDITRQAQMVLSCVVRIHNKLHYYVGKELVVQVLRGSKARRTQNLGLDELTTYGLLRDLSLEQLRAMVEYLTSEGYLRLNNNHFTLEPTPKTADVLFHGEQVSMRVRMDNVQKRPDTPAVKKPAAAVPAGVEDLFETLRAVRTRLARAENVPAYIICSNATLADMAAKKPRTQTELLSVSGIGEVKAERYGEAFLNSIAAYQGQAQ
jgi:ATP-dependent DNA helicase RecQ